MPGRQHAVDLVVSNRQGIHLNSASQIVRTANRFQARIALHVGDRIVDAKNVMEILQLAAGPKTRVRLVAEGPDAAEAVAAIIRLFEDRFGET